MPMYQEPTYIKEKRFREYFLTKIADSVHTHPTTLISNAKLHDILHSLLSEINPEYGQKEGGK